MWVVCAKFKGMEGEVSIPEGKAPLDSEIEAQIRQLIANRLGAVKGDYTLKKVGAGENGAVIWKIEGARGERSSLNGITYTFKTAEQRFVVIEDIPQIESSEVVADYVNGQWNLNRRRISALG